VSRKKSNRNFMCDARLRNELARLEATGEYKDLKIVGSGPSGIIRGRDKKKGSPLKRLYPKPSMVHEKVDCPVVWYNGRRIGRALSVSINGGV